MAENSKVAEGSKKEVASKQDDVGFGQAAADEIAKYLPQVLEFM